VIAFVCVAFPHSGRGFVFRSPAHPCCGTAVMVFWRVKADSLEESVAVLAAEEVLEAPAAEPALEVLVAEEAPVEILTPVAPPAEETPSEPPKMTKVLGPSHADHLCSHACFFAASA